MVMSIGWNPFYQNEKRAMETHLLHQFQEDLYGKLLKVAVLGYLRPERNFESLQDLIKAIENDIKQAEEKLSDPAVDKFKNDEFFSS
jgi:riboflavin kinase